jgi:hypothetical protein
VSVDVDLNHDGKFSGPNELGVVKGAVDDTGRVAFNLPIMQKGTYELRARVSDKAGNEGLSTPVAMEVSDDPLAKLPLSFEANQGQGPDEFGFLARAQNYAFGLSATGLTVGLFYTPDVVPPPVVPQPVVDPTIIGMDGEVVGGTLPETETPREMLPLGVNFVGGNMHAQGMGLDRLQGKVNYFIGNDPDK